MRVAASEPLQAPRDASAASDAIWQLLLPIAARVMALLAALLPAALSPALPITCQPFQQHPDFPSFHIMGYVSEREGGALGRESINDCSGVIHYQGVYHVFHQCCQVRPPPSPLPSPFAELRARRTTGTTSSART